MTVTTIRVGLLGCGVVGGSLASLLETRGDDIAARSGIRFEIGPVAVRDLSKPRPAGISPVLFTTDTDSVVDDPDVDVIVELMGGIDPARQLIEKALANGKPVVTGNKALLSSAGSELFALADDVGVDLLFEASVAGGIPFIRPLRESLAGEQIFRVMGILNGTTNYILTKMTEEGADYADALAEAKALGYAEEDPTADVEGHDAAAKAAIISSIVCGGDVRSDDVFCTGIAGITPGDIAQASKLGMVVKLLGIVEEHPEGVSVRVHPTLIPDTHPLASVRDSFNAIFVEGAAVGDLMFYGRGAGGGPTASAVLGDLIDAAQNLVKNTHSSFVPTTTVPVVSIDAVSSAFYLDVTVRDRPGVLAAVAGALGDHQVSIQSMEQIGLGGEARLLFITHTALEADMNATLEALRHLDVVESVNSVLRVLGQ